MNSLSIQQLSKTYANGVVALHEVSLTITNGMFGLLGPNGAGKSTLMKTIAGLQKPTYGSIFFNENDIIAHPEIAKRQLGYLPHLLDHLAILKGVPTKSARREQIEALLEQTNLYSHRNRAVSSYSGGMRQRFGIAQALLGSPKLIIVDEPTAGLDPEERNRFNNMLSEIGEQIIVILSTHIVEDVRNLCTQMAIINKGRILAEGAPEHFVSLLKGTIWSRKIHRNELAEIIANHNVLSSQLNGGRLSIHVHSETQPDGFEPKSVDLEDVYFYQLQSTSSC